MKSVVAEGELHTPIYLLSVMPLSRGGGVDELSYFSRSPHTSGSVIKIPLRGKNIRGVVLSSKNASGEKLSLKKGAFALRKIEAQAGSTIFLPTFLEAAQALALQYATRAGIVIRSLVSAYILEVLPPRGSNEKVPRDRTKPERCAYEAPYHERLLSYQRLIRTSFARGKSVLIIAPTIEEVRQLKEKLGSGIEHRIFDLTGNLPKKEYVKRWVAAQTKHEAVALIGTPTLLSIPRGDVGTIVLERESARSYSLPQRPYLHVGDVVSALGTSMGARVILADEILSITTHYRLKAAEIESLEEMSPRAQSRAEVTIVDARTPLDSTSRVFSSLQPPLKKAISETLAKNGHAFIFVARRGLGSAIVCRDCGERVSCAICSSPVSLRTIKQKRLFYCSRCESSRSARERCKKCDSWNLLALGIGSERVYDDALKLFGKERVHLLDQETAPDHKTASAIRDRWRMQRGSLLIGTEMSLPYIRDGVRVSAVASLDSILASPEWRAHERVFTIITSLASFSREVIVQTRRPDEEVLLFARNNMIREHVERELTLRKKFGYPPFKTLIMLTFIGTSARVAKEALTLENKFSSWEMHRHATPAPRGKTREVMLIKTEPVIPEPLHQLLCELPPFVSVAINPENTY